MAINNEYKITPQTPILSGFDSHTTALEVVKDNKTTEQGAATSVWCATNPLLDDKGGVYCLDCDIAEAISDFSLQGMGQQLTGVLPWAIDREMAKRLWTMSEEMTGVKF